MSKSATMLIAFPFGGILPSSVTGGDEKKIPPHEGVRVPRDYGEHLVSDRFAYEFEDKKKQRAPANKPDLAKLENAVSQAELDLAAATDDEAKAKAEAALAAARQDLAKATS